MARPIGRRSRLAAIALNILFGPLTPAFAADAGDTSADIHLAGGRLLGSGPDRLSLGVGAFNVFPNGETASQNEDTSFEGRVEYRFGEKWYVLGPLVGFMANTDAGLYGYGGLYADLQFGNWVITPSAGFGGYVQNNSKDLGGVFQFQLSIEVGYQFQNASRLALRISHISNAGIQDNNPGQESLLVTYSIPFRF